MAGRSIRTETIGTGDEDNKMRQARYNTKGRGQMRTINKKKRCRLGRAQRWGGGMKGTGETRFDNEQRYVQEKEHGSLKQKP
jgi:hypothetical protein